MKENHKNRNSFHLNPNTENPRGLIMMIMSGKVKMCVVIAQHVFHDDEKGWTG